MAGYTMFPNELFDEKFLVFDPVTEKERPMRPTEKIVYTYFIHMRNKDKGYAWPSYQTIGKKCGMSQRTAITTVAVLEHNKLIVKRHRHDPNNGNNLSNSYRVNPLGILNDNLKYMPYKEYLKTKHWKDISKKAREKAKHRCELCNSKEKINVHHRTYENRGSESLSDLIVLCNNCHAKFHDKLETPY